MGIMRGTWGTFVFVSMALTGCYEGEELPAEEGTSGGESTGASMTAAGPVTSASATSASTTSPGDCIEGQEACTCLEGQCAGSLFCVENSCQRGPEFDGPDDPMNVIAGLRVPVEVEVMADEYSWSQGGGPMVGLDNTEGQTVLVNIPPDTPAGQTVSIQMNAIRNGVEGSFTVELNIMQAEFRDALGDINDAEQLATPQAISFRGGDIWVTNGEGFVSWFGSGDEAVEYRGRYDIPGQPVHARMGTLPQGEDQDGLDVLYVANAMNQSIEAVILGNGDVQTITSETAAGDPLGPVRAVLPAGNGNLLFVNPEGGQLYFYEDELDETRVLATDIGTNATALSFGPDINVLFLGSQGRVWRVPLLDDGTAGDASAYLQLGPQDDPTLEVGSILFDRGQNMYVSTPGTSTLHLARYRAGEATSVIREFVDVGNGISEFTSFAFGDGEFGGDVLYYANPTSGQVGQIQVGLGR